MGVWKQAINDVVTNIFVAFFILTGLVTGGLGLNLLFSWLGSNSSNVVLFGAFGGLTACGALFTAGAAMLLLSGSGESNGRLERLEKKVSRLVDQLR